MQITTLRVLACHFFPAGRQRSRGGGGTVVTVDAFFFFFFIPSYYYTGRLSVYQRFNIQNGTSVFRSVDRNSKSDLSVLKRLRGFFFFLDVEHNNRLCVKQ